MSEDKSFDFQWFEALMKKDLGKRKWVVDKLMPEEGIIVIAGRASTYKTWICMHLALCLSTGRPFLGRFEVMKCPVIYIDEENTEISLKERWTSLCNGTGIEIPPKTIGILTQTGIKINRIKDLEWLEKKIKETGAKCIIIDVFARAHSLPSENESAPMNRLVNDIMKQKISKKYGVTWILIHHQRKPINLGGPEDLLASIRGTSELGNLSDACFVLDNVIDGFVIYTAKNRHAKTLNPQFVEVNIDDRKDKAIFLCKGDAELELDNTSKCARCIKIWMASKNITQFTTKDAHTAMINEGYRKRIVTNALTLLVQQGHLIRPGRGVYRLPDEIRPLSDAR